MLPLKGVGGCAPPHGVPIQAGKGSLSLSTPASPSPDAKCLALVALHGLGKKEGRTALLPAALAQG